MGVLVQDVLIVAGVVTCAVGRIVGVAVVARLGRVGVVSAAHCFRRGAAVLKTAVGVGASRRRDAVALHFLLAQLSDHGGGHHLGDDLELSVFQIFIGDEAHERLAVHGQARFRRLRREVGFGLPRERGVVAEQARVVSLADQHGVQRRGVLLARADHFIAAHLLLGLLGYLDGGDG